MGISKTGVSRSITKEDLKNTYMQGFVDGVKEVRERIDCMKTFKVDVEYEKYYSSCQPKGFIVIADSKEEAELTRLNGRESRPGTSRSRIQGKRYRSFPRETARERDPKHGGATFWFLHGGDRRFQPIL